jgi:hypothetical protein
VNLFIKRLAKKGYFKITTIPKKRVQYILTPKGLSEKSRLTYQYIRYSLQYYKNTRAKLKTIFDNLSKQEVDEVILYGVSELAEISYITLRETGLPLKAIVDEELAGEMFMDFLIKPLSYLKRNDAKHVVVITKIEKSQNLYDIININGIDTYDIIDLREYAV